MDFVTNFLTDNMFLLFFVNGLAFFVMGLVIAVETRRTSELRMTESLWLLNVWAFMASLGNWLRMVSLAQRQPVSAGDSFSVHAANVFWFVLGTLFLFTFGTRLIATVKQSYQWLRWSPPVLLLLYLSVIVFKLPNTGGSGSDWLSVAEVAARYILYLPSLALSGLALLFQRRSFLEMKWPRIARNCLEAASAFGFKTVVSGLIALPILGVPEYVLSVLVVPIQLLRTVSTLTIAYFLVRTLRFFEIERRRQLEVAMEQRLQAQQEALEAQRQAHTEVQRRTSRLEDMVNAIASAISKPLALEEVLDIALCRVLELTEFEGGEMFLVQEERRELVLIAQSGLPETMAMCGTRIMLGQGITGDLYTSGETIVVRSILEDSRLRGMPCQEAGFQVLISVPVSCRGNVLGVMNLLGKSKSAPEAHELGVLSAVGQQIGVAIENARLYSQVKSVAALEERARLSRELHDGLAQVLGYLNLKSKVVETLLTSDQVSQARVELRDLQEIAGRAYDDVREAILGLRATMSAGQGLIPALKEYAHRFSEQTGISVALEAEDRINITFAPETEVQLLGIIQEALTNVRRHSQASKARIAFDVEGERVLVTVEDNGQGFDVERVERHGDQHFGLETMKERAESVGGGVQIHSQPGQGTRVWIELPLSQQGGLWP